MKSHIDHNVVSTLQMEYNSARQELRDLIKSMDTNFNTAVAIISGLVAFAGFCHDIRILFVIPSIIFLSCAIHQLKMASANIQGAYCQGIELKLKMILGSKKVLLDWEKTWIPTYKMNPRGIVQVGFYFAFIPVVALFWVIASYAYTWHKWTLLIHIFEFLSMAIYSLYSMRWNSPHHRDKVLNQYLANNGE